MVDDLFPDSSSPSDTALIDRDLPSIDETTLRQATLASASLSDRHRELLRYVAEGLTSKDMAQRTRMKVPSINNSLAQATRILDCRNRWDAAVLLAAIETGSAPVMGRRQRSVIAAHETLSGNAVVDQSPAKAPSSIEIGLRWLKGPPLGGVDAPADWQTKSLSVLRVAFVGLLCLVGLTLFILAFFATFGVAARS